MNGAWILIIGCLCLFLGYVFYGRHVAKQFGIDPSRPTPSHTEEDGIDYCPAKPSILIGHHFSSIAGAGPITGPIQAAVFGWIPVTLWVIIGGIFFGAVHDFGSTVLSVRNKGKSICDIIKDVMNERARRIFLVFCYATLVIVVAAFVSIVGDTFAGSAGTELGKSCASAATSSVAMIFLALVLGYILNRYHPSTFVSVLIAIAMLALSMVIGNALPIYLDSTAWMAIMSVYIIIASILPVWMLLQPRDFICSFLLYGMMILSFVGILFSSPEMSIPGMTSFETKLGYLFPALFVTIACGAISGFHCLVSSGTTSKQVDNERNILPISYGSMLLESMLALIALISVGFLFDGSMPSGTPTEIFAGGITKMFVNLGMGSSYELIYTLFILSISAFALTSLDTATRLGRMILQELVDFTKFKFLRSSKIGIAVISTLITVGLSLGLALIGYQKIWGIFAASNQLLAAMALMTITFWLSDLGKKYRFVMYPMVFMLITSTVSLVMTCIDRIRILTSGFDAAALAQVVLCILLLVMAVFIAREAVHQVKERRSGERDVSA